MPRKSSSSRPAPQEITLRIRVLSPPPGILFCIQGKRGEFLQQTRSKGDDLVFEIVARATEDSEDQRPRLLGHSVQGPPTARFLYICSGTYAGEKETPWGRRAKVPLAGITSDHVLHTRGKGVLQATIAGTGRDGGPACGTVPLVREWTVVK